MEAVTEETQLDADEKEVESEVVDQTSDLTEALSTTPEKSQVVDEIADGQSDLPADILQEEPTSDITMAMITPILADAKLELRSALEEEFGADEQMAAEVADAVIDEAVQDKENAIKFYMVANENASPEQADKIASDVVSDEILDAAVEADEEKKQEEAAPFMGGTSFFYIDAAEPTFDDAMFAVAKDNAADVVAVQVQGREGIDAGEAKDIATNIINDVVEKLDVKTESKKAE